MAYGIENIINGNNKNNCIKMCLIDENGPDYRYTAIDVLPVPSGYSSVSHKARFHSECSCYDQNELDRSIEKAAEQKEWSDKFL